MAAAINRRRDLFRQRDEVLLDKAKGVLFHHSRIEDIRTAHRSLQDAQALLIEARSEVDRLKEKNAEIKQRLEAEKDNVKLFARETAEKKLEAQEALGGIQGFDTDERDALLEQANGRTNENLEAELNAERAKLDVIQANNPQALQEYEDWTRRISRERANHTNQETRLRELEEKIERVRGVWEPRLDELVGRINEAFSYNFEQISCAGEVGVHKDEDFSKWAIEIKVKFRYVDVYLDEAGC